MKNVFLLIVFLSSCLFASGGDTVRLTSRYRIHTNDDDTIYSWWWHDPIDSTVKIVNGRLGDLNIAADAKIKFSKLDTTGTLKARRINVDTLSVDTIKCKGQLSVDTIYAKRVSLTRTLTADSAALRAISGKDSLSLQIDHAQLNDAWFEGDIKTTGGVDINLTDSIGADTVPHYKYASLLKIDSLTARAARVRRLRADTLYLHHDSTDTSYRENGAIVRDSLKYVLIDSIKSKKFYVDTIVTNKITNASADVDSFGTFVLHYPVGQFVRAQLDTVWFKKSIPYGNAQFQTVELYFKTLSDSSNGTTFATDTLVPVSVRPLSNTNVLLMSVYDGAATRSGGIQLTSGGALSFLKESSGLITTFTNSGLKGHPSQTIKYLRWR
jgi:hypothetical protein